MSKQFLLGIGLPLAGILVWSATLFAGPTTAFGPPAVCFPFEIGSDATVPDKFGGDFVAANMVDEVCAVLATNERTLVHMETLRRAVWALITDDSKGADSRRDALGHALVSRLRWRVLEGLSATEPLAPEAVGQLWFDLAYCQGALHQALRFPDEGNLEAMGQAMSRLQSNGAAQFGCALALWEHDDRGEFGFYPRMLAALRHEDGGDPDLMANLLSMGGNLVGTSGREALIAKLEQRLVRK